MFISGPLLTAIIATVASPAAALIVSAVAVITGTAVFTALPPTRHVEPEEHTSRGLLGALASPGVRTLVLISLPTGIGIGMLEVGIPAFSRAEGAAATAGILLAIWSFGSGVGGLLYGTLPRRRGLHRTHLLVSGLLPLTLLPLAAAPSVWVMALLVIPAGCCIAPLLATRNELVGGVAPPGMRTEAYTWPITAFVAGIAAGAALGGVLAEGPGVADGVRGRGRRLPRSARRCPCSGARRSSPPRSREHGRAGDRALRRHQPRRRGAAGGAVRARRAATARIVGGPVSGLRAGAGRVRRGRARARRCSPTTRCAGSA